MQIKNGAHAPMGTACAKKATRLYFVTHPKTANPLLGPFLNAADAEYGRQVIRSADAVVTAGAAEPVNALTYWRALNNGRICRLFAGEVRHD